MWNTSSSSQVTLLLKQIHALEVNEAIYFRHNWYLQHALLQKSAMHFKGINATVNSNTEFLGKGPCHRKESVRPACPGSLLIFASKRRN